MLCPWKPCGQSCSAGASHIRQTQTLGDNVWSVQMLFRHGRRRGRPGIYKTYTTRDCLARLQQVTAAEPHHCQREIKVKKSRAGLPLATVRVLHVHPPLGYGAVEEDLRKHVLRFVMEFRPGAIAGDGNKSVNASSKFPDHGLFNRPRRARGTHSKTWNPLTVWASPRTHLRLCDTDLLNKCFCNCTACVEIANLGLRAKVVPSRT